MLSKSQFRRMSVQRTARLATFAPLTDEDIAIMKRTTAARDRAASALLDDAGDSMLMARALDMRATLESAAAFNRWLANGGAFINCED